MKAIVKAREDAGAMEVRDLPIPEPGPGEVLVKMKAAGICFSDVMILTNKYKGRVPVPIPMIMGHEGAGEVADVGKGVTQFRYGDKVGLNPLWGCGQCVDCLNGHPNMCRAWRHLGITCDGTFAEYRAVPAFTACKLPDSVSPVDAAFMEPISLTVRTFEHVKPVLGDTVAIIGPGSIGLFHLQAFKSAGAAKIMVIGLDQDAKRFEIAKKLVQYIKRADAFLGKMLSGGAQAALLLVLCLAAILSLVYHWLSVVHPYSLDYGEVPLIDQAMRLGEGDNIYRSDLSEPPLTISNYPPIFVAVLAPFIRVFGPNFWAGRLISWVASIGSAIFVGMIIYSLTKDRFAAVISGLLFTAFPYVIAWSSFGRIDSLALMFSLAGLLILVQA